MTRAEWIDAMERQLARTMPDMYPSGYARFLAEERDKEGGYDNYIAGKYADNHLWEPDA